MTSTPTLLATELRFQYATGTRPRVLDIARMEVGTGERIFLQGASGSGKTTLLGLISGVLAGFEGQLEVLGENFAEISAARRDVLRGERMGYIFQMFNLIPYLTVEENIALPCRLHAHRRERITEPTVAAEVRRLATELSIAPLLGKSVTQLSVGQQQRVAAARALIGRPALIIADEPTSALDFEQREKFIELLMKECEREKAALLFVSHDPTLAKLFDRRLHMQDINRTDASLGTA